jgi:hypothetical protein
MVMKEKAFSQAKRNEKKKKKSFVLFFLVAYPLPMEGEEGKRKKEMWNLQYL